MLRTPAPAPEYRSIDRNKLYFPIIHTVLSIPFNSLHSLEPGNVPLLVTVLHGICRSAEHGSTLQTTEGRLLQHIPIKVPQRRTAIQRRRIAIIAHPNPPERPHHNEGPHHAHGQHLILLLTFPHAIAIHDGKECRTDGSRIGIKFELGKAILNITREGNVVKGSEGCQGDTSGKESDQTCNGRFNLLAKCEFGSGIWCACACACAGRR